MQKCKVTAPPRPCSVQKGLTPPHILHVRMQRDLDPPMLSALGLLPDGRCRQPDTPTPCMGRNLHQSCGVRLSLHRENRRSDRGPLPRQGCTASSPPMHGYGWGGSTGIQSGSDTPPPHARMQSGILPDSRMQSTMFPLHPPQKKPPKSKHQKTAKRGRPPKPYKATGTPPHLPPPQPPAHLRRLRGGAPGELRGAGGPGAGAGLRLPPCREPRAAPQCSHSACAPPAPLRPAPPRSAPLRSTRAAAAPPPPVLWELRARLRPAEMRGGRVPFSPSRQRPLLLAPQQDDQPRADPHLQ